MNKLVKKSLPLVCVVTQLMAMLLFAFSFFNVEETLFSAGSAANTGHTMGSRSAVDLIRSDVHYKQIDDYCRPRVATTTTNNKPMFNKLVLVVIDALRHDFIPSIDRPPKSVQSGDRRHRQRRASGDSGGHRMPFTETIMQTNGVGLVSISATPTVTMPRIKAMISGTLPSFMDFILNLSAYRFNGENIVENAFKANKKTVFFGDDTWIQLLPKEVFAKYNGTSSFFATDYTEVDTNVTYCVRRELKALHEWDVMITHYLGVDHIGHSHGGYHSKLMPKKLLEMDAVVESIYTRVSAPDVREPYLVVITGDHGMTDIGNHGGNTPPETDTALVFLTTNGTKVSRKRTASANGRAERVLQVDISPTLSALLGLPLPNKSIGKVMLNVLNALSMPTDQQMCHMFANAVQISHLLPELSADHKSAAKKAFKFHAKLIANQTDTTFNADYHYKTAADSYDTFIASIQLKLMTKFTEKSFFSLITLSIVFAIVSIVGFAFIDYRNRCSILWTKVKDIQTVFAIVVVALNCVLLLSTSYMEYEHYFWYYMTSTIAFIQLAIAVRNHYRSAHPAIVSLVDPFTTLQENTLLQMLAVVLILILARVSNYWNVLNGEDIGQWLNKSDNKRVLSALVICSLIAISYLMSTKRFGKQQCLLISGLFWVYLYRSDCGTVSSFKIPSFLYVSRNIRAKIVFFHVYLIIFESFLKRLRKYFNLSIPFLDFLQTDNSSPPTAPESQPVTSVTLRTLCTIWILLSALFFKVHNIPLLAINIGLEKLVNYASRAHYSTRTLHTLVAYLCFAESAFYSAGNSNTLSTIDVSPAFIGLDSYQPVLAALFMIINTYSLYVYWLLMFFIRLKDGKYGSMATTTIATSGATSAHRLWSVVNVLLIIRFTTILFDMCVTIVLQNHLFIWSVLCPKFLYEGLLTLVNEMIVLFVILNNFID